MRYEIAAISIISLSEIKKVRPDLTWDKINESEQSKKEFDELLFSLGMNVKDYPYEVQKVKHRNKFNEVVRCERMVGLERLDKEWLASGYATDEAIDKAKGNKLLVDLYRLRSAVE
jgi:hypothetical protein